MIPWLLLLTLPSLAQEQAAPPPPPDLSEPAPPAPPDLPEPPPAASSSKAPAPKTVGVRYRHTWLPQAVLDPWYFREADSGHPRPTAHAHLFGVEYTVDTGPGLFSAWAEYWAVNMEEGYWDDKEQPPVHTDGDWLRPVGLAMIAAGGNFGHAFSIIPREQTVGLDFAVMGGLGLGIPLGHFEQWYPGSATEPLTDCHPTAMSTVRYSQCEPDEIVKPPVVLPILDLTLAFRVHIAQRATLRFEGGLHNTPYVGVAGGGTF